MEYKTKTRIIFILANVEYNESFCQLSHTRSNDETVISNALIEEK